MYLGKLPRKEHPKTLWLSNYLLPDAPPPPPEKTFWEYKIPPATIGMYGNDVCGCCTWAEIAHYLMLATAHAGKAFVPDPAAVQACYVAMTGYDPSKTDAFGNNPTDTGCAITDVLNYMQTIGLQGHKILGWAEIGPNDIVRRNQGVYIFGGNDVGVQLPAAAETQFNTGKDWEVVNGDSIRGGHCILESGYGRSGRNFETWGKGDQKASNDWSSAYLDEAYVIFTKDWLNEATGLAPNALNMDALVADLKAIAA